MELSATISANRRAELRHLKYLLVYCSSVYNKIRHIGSHKTKFFLLYPFVNNNLYQAHTKLQWLVYYRAGLWKQKNVEISN